MPRDIFLPAYKKGYKARKEGLSRTACPYEDHRKPSGKVSWSRAWRNTWLQGWECADRDAKYPDARKEKP